MRNNLNFNGCLLEDKNNLMKNSNFLNSKETILLLNSKNSDSLENRQLLSEQKTTAGNQNFHPENQNVRPFYPDNSYNSRNEFTDFLLPYSDNSFRSSVKRMKAVSIASIVGFVFWLIFLIILIVIVASKSPTDFTDSFENTFGYIIVALLLSISWVLGIVVHGIVGSIASSIISKKDKNFHQIMFIYIIGIFIPFVQVVGACMSLSRLKKIRDSL